MENAGVGKEGDEEHIWILPPYPGEKYWFPFDILNGPHRQSQLMLEADIDSVQSVIYRGADKSLPRPERKQATATEDFDFHISYL